jgi:ubiquinone/menaquinone biosynthesis C-methylase UbiE
MAVTDKLFAGSIPEVYDRYLVPLIFDSYAHDLAERLGAVRPRDVLETAAGTGALTRAIEPRLAADARMVATDLNQPMLDRAAARQPHAGRIAWQRADALALPFEDERFDAVACQFGVMFFPDKQKAFRQARRVLKPGGHFIFNVWDSIEHNEFADLVTAAAADMFADDPPRFLARTPHGYHDKQAIIAEVRSAGFVNVAAETVTRRSVAPSCRDPAIGYCQGTPLRNEIEVRDASRLAEATEAAAGRIKARFGSGSVDGMIQAHVITASD